MIYFHGLVQEIRGRNNRQSGEKSRQKSKNLRNRPSGSDLVGDFAHGCDQYRAVEPFRIGEVDEKADRTAHGLAVEETRQALKVGVLLDGSEEGEAVVDDKIDVRDEGPEALGSAMALEVESETSETHLSEEDWSGLEGPADVVAVTVDHEDDGAWRGERKP